MKKLIWLVVFAVAGLTALLMMRPEAEAAPHYQSTPTPTPTAISTPLPTAAARRIRWDQDNTRPEYQVVLRFGTKPTGTLLNTTLNFSVTNVVTPPMQVGVFAVTPKWVGPWTDWYSFYHHREPAEAWTLWDTAGALGAGDTPASPTYTVTISAIGWYTADVQGLVAGWSGSNTDLLMRTVAATQTQEISITTEASAADKPYLTMDVIQ